MYLGRLPLTGALPLGAALVMLLLGLGLLALARHRLGRAWRRASTAVVVVGGLAVVAVGVNTVTGAYPTVSALVRPPLLPMVDGLHPTSDREYAQGAVARIQVPDTASHFGVFDAQVYLPPQYFSEPNRRFPLVLLAHGNPGASTEWLDYGDAQATGLATARAGHPVILAMPTVLQQAGGDSLCVDTQSQGHAEAYVVRDVVNAADSQLRTLPQAAHRAIGGYSMGGFCALNLGLKHPDVFSVVLAFSALTVCQPDAIRGGNQALFGGSDWQERVAENSPAEYYSGLDPARGPALWLEAGADEELAAPLQAFAAELAGSGFTVVFQERPGGHSFSTWSSALAAALPWAAARL